MPGMEERGRQLELSKPRIHEVRELVDLNKQILKAVKMRWIG